MVLGTLSETRYNEVVEERLAMGKCANIYCKSLIPASVKDKSTSRKFFVQDKQLRKIGSEPLLFCRGSEADLATKSDKCKEAYEAILSRVTTQNEGGPFGTPMRDLLDFLKKQLEHPNLHEIDKRKILKITEEFDTELAKVAAPRIVEKRIVNEKDGNPSD